MIRLTRIVPSAFCLFCLLAAIAATGCRRETPSPLPDAAVASGLTLSAEPDSLVIRPGSSGRIKFLLRDELGLPVANYPLDFAILDDGSGYGTTGAQLSSSQGLTDGNGSAVLEVIVGSLSSDNRPVSFYITATYQGSASTQAYITVTTNAYSVEILPVPAVDLLGSTSIVSTKLLFFDDTTCGDLDLTNLNAAPTRPRSTPQHPVAANSTWVFSGVAASGSHAVVGLGLDSNTFIQIGGCVDIPGSSLIESETIRAILFMDRLFPVPLGTYQVKSDFAVAPAPAGLGAAIQSAWRQWTRCPLDPARLWLDCTLDALATDPAKDPLDCIPMSGAEGELGDRLLPRRGQVVAPDSGATASAADTPCRGPTDSAGNASLEAIVASLFSGTSGQLSGAKLDALPDEIATLLANFRVDSQMTITASGADINSYTVRHDLLELTFPSALTSTSFKAQALGLPVSSVSGILATLKAGQLSIPSHGFTLRLGTAARYAFEATSLKNRGAQDAGNLVKAIFALAQKIDQGNVLSGCDALDAAVCDELNQSRPCLLDACQKGLAALATDLAAAFDSLDGSGLDFFLYGYSPVVDLDNDGRADALGLGGRAGTVAAGPGWWLAALNAQWGGAIYGSWTATKVTKAP
ncbi:MAG TPA: hypothetical protein VF524_01680 [Polyangia bacterium]